MSTMTYGWVEEKLEIVDAAVREVFERMLWEECRVSNVDWARGERICAWIEMRGEPEGCCRVEVAAAAGDLLTDTLLGSEGDWDAELIDDAVGELCNMITGGVKSRLGAKPGACRITLPMVLRTGGDSRFDTGAGQVPVWEDAAGIETVRRLYWFGQASTLAVTLQLRKS